ncbi:MAG: hypothetical protein ACNA8W_02400, partial [Bradymonadaceae bacterium]
MNPTKNNKLISLGIEAESILAIAKNATTAREWENLSERQTVLGALLSQVDPANIVHDFYGNFFAASDAISMLQESLLQRVADDVATDEEKSELIKAFIRQTIRDREHSKVQLQSL